MVSRWCWPYAIILVTAHAAVLAGDRQAGTRKGRGQKPAVAVFRPARVQVMGGVDDDPVVFIEEPGAERNRTDREEAEDEEEEDASSGVDPTISDSVFAHWVFGMEDARDARRRLKEVLGTRVDEAEATYRITPAQRRKLELAGKGDIQRFFDHVALKREELDRLGADEHKTRRFVLTELIPLRGKIRQGPFGEGSLFAKTLNKMLNDRQLGRQATR